jgi:hypothetical protein
MSSYLQIAARRKYHPVDQPYQSGKANEKLKNHNAKHQCHRYRAANNSDPLVDALLTL